MAKAKSKVNVLTVKDFRGISLERSLDFSNKFLVLYGANGTGKSSFVNALEYLFTGRLDILDFQASKKDAHLHRNSPKEDMLVDLKIGSDHITRTYDDIHYPDNLKKYMDDPALFNGSFILNRNKLLEFISEGDTYRYQSILKICGFDNLNDLHKGVYQTKKLFKSECDNCEKEINLKNSQISNYFNKESLGYEEVFKEINSFLKDLNIEKTIDEETDLNMFLADLKKYSNFYSIQKHVEEFYSVYENLDLNINARLEGILRDYESFAINQLKSSDLLLNVLNKSKELLELENLDNCPVCNSEINNKAIISDLENNIQGLKSDLGNFNKWEINVHEFIMELRSIINDFNRINRILDDLMDLDDEFSIKIDLKNDINKINELISLLEDLIVFKSSIFELYEFNFDSVKQEVEEIKTNFDENYSNFDDESLSKLNDLNHILLILKDYIQLKYKFDDLKIQSDVAEKTFEFFDKSEKELFKELISEIGEDIFRYYDYIHGKDDINSPKLKMQSTTKVRILLNSFGAETDPRSFASEGHLDTLGLCIFLAFEKRFNSLNFIVLDDVVSTVDLNHKSKIIRLLLEEFSQYKFLITTHNSIWAEQIKRLTEATKGVSAKIMEIVDWTLDEGPVVIERKGFEEKVRQYLNQPIPDTNAAANTLRRYVEYFLMEFAKVNKSIKLPFLEHYMVDDLWVPVKKHIKDTVKEDTALKEHYEIIIQNFDSTLFYTNYLSHFNIDSEHITYDELIECSEYVFTLKDSLICNECKNFLKFDKGRIYCPNGCDCPINTKKD